MWLGDWRDKKSKEKGKEQWWLWKDYRKDDMNNYDDDDVTADEVINEEHRLERKGIPAEKAHKIIRKKYDDDDDSLSNYDFTKGFKKIIRGGN